MNMNRHEGDEGSDMVLSRDGAVGFRFSWDHIIIWKVNMK